MHQRANPGFSIQTGERRSQGVEVSAQARIVPGWDVLAFYADVDAEITEDTTFAVGNQLPNTSRHSGGLWTTWPFPSGPLRGLGAGFGFRYVEDLRCRRLCTMELGAGSCLGVRSAACTGC